MNKAETSFKELVGDMQVFAPIHVRDIIIETLKNITHQSFGDKNIFESSLIDPNGRVQYKYHVVENQVTEIYWNNLLTFTYPYEQNLNGVTIPLATPKWGVGSKARLVIGVTGALPVSQISIQFYVDNVDKWVTVPCKTNTVKETIMNLFPQE